MNHDLGTRARAVRDNEPFDQSLRTLPVVFSLSFRQYAVVHLLAEHALVVVTAMDRKHLKSAEARPPDESDSAGGAIHNR